MCMLLLCAVMLMMLLSATVLATESAQENDKGVPELRADDITDVSTVAELRTALENDAGAYVRLTKNITFTKANAADRDIGVYLGEGCYTIDLNGFTLKYHYMTGGEFTDQGTPLGNAKAKLLVINGPGSLIGGTHGLEQFDQFSTLIVNGGTFKGVMGFGIRMTGGITYMNGGTVTGNFGGIEHADGIVILNGGNVKSVVHKPRGSITPKKYGLIKDSVFTGNTVLEDIILVVPDLTIKAGSSIKLIRGGGLVVKNSLVNNGTLTYESGLKSIGGKAVISKDFQVTIRQDMTFSSVSLQERARLTIENGATVTVSDTFVTEQDCSVIAKNGTLRLLGSINHKGYAEGVPELEALQDGNGGGGPGPGAGPEQRDFIAETTAAEKLKVLGLFQGVGNNPDGSTNFDLARTPSRSEALVMLIRLLGKDNEAISGSWTHPFTDVPKWADNYVGYAYENKLTNGISATKFGTGTASSKMYLTFVLRALGYSDTGGSDFTWDNPEALALSVGIMAEGMHHENFLRADVALVSEAALSVKLKDSRDTLLDKLIADGAVNQIP